MSQFRAFLKKRAQKLARGKILTNLSDLKKVKNIFKTSSEKELKLEYFNQISFEYEEVISIETKIKKEFFSQYMRIINNVTRNFMDYFEFSRYLQSRIFDTDQWKKSDDQHRKGILAETAVRIVLMVLEKQNIINDFMMTENYSLLDMDGIDTQIVYVTSKGYQHMPLQIKSSHSGQQEHIEKYEHSIPSLVVNLNFDFFEIRKKLNL